MSTAAKRPTTGKANVLCFCTTLRKASRQLSRFYDDALEGSGVKTTQRAILAQIRRSEPVSVKDLADALVMDAAAMTHTLKPLQRDKLISSSIDPEDRRNRRITLTPRGHAKIAASDMGWIAAQKALEAAVGEQKLGDIREVLAFIASDAFAIRFGNEISQEKGAQ